MPTSTPKLTIKSQGATFKIYNEGLILCRDVRFSYPHLDEPWSKNEGETKKFSLRGLAPKKTHGPMRDAIKLMADAMLAAHKGGIRMAASDKFLRDGDAGAKDEEAGMFTISSSELSQPSVRGFDAKPIPQAEIRKAIQGGYWGDMLIKPWIQDNKHGKKLNAGLIGVQLKKKDETFGEGRYSDDDIDDVFEGVDQPTEEGFPDDGDMGGL